MEHMNRTEKVNLQIYALIEIQQRKNGLNHNNVQQYRQYLTRRLSRLYSSLGLKHGKRKYKDVVLTVENCTTSEHLNVLVDLAERAWAMAENRKQEIVSNPSLRFRVKHHITRRMKKAVAWSAKLCCIANCNADETTNIECQAYHAELSGRCKMHLELYEDAKSYFQKAYEFFASLQKKHCAEKWSLVSIRISKIDELYRQCQIYLKEDPETSNAEFRLNVDSIQWGDNRVLLSSHRVIELHKKIQEFEKKQEAIIEGVNWASQRMHTFNKRIDTFDKIIDSYDEIIDICGKNMQKGDVTDDMRIEQNYFFFQRQHARCNRIDAYIHFYEEIKFSHRKKGKVSKDNAELMHLYERLSALAQDCSMIPGLSKEVSEEYLARSQFAKASALYFKSLAWCDMHMPQKGIACLQAAQYLLRESLIHTRSEKAFHCYERVRMEYVRMLLIHHGPKPQDDRASEEKKDCITNGLESKCQALAPALPSFKPIFPKRAFYDCAYTFLDVPEIVYDKGKNRIVEKNSTMHNGWLGGWFS